MIRWSLADDDPIDDQVVTRTCAVCGEAFRLLVAGEYPIHVLCEQCTRNESAKREQEAERPLKATAR